VMDDDFRNCIAVLKKIGEKRDFDPKN